MTGSFVTPEFRDRIRGLATPIATGFGRIGLTPNALTVIGFLGTCVAAFAAATQQWFLAGVLVIAFGIFDMFDGALARATGTTSKFGAFLDSTLDRTGESLVYVGIAVGSVAATGYIEGVILAGLAGAFASGVTYTRAKAESLGVRGDVGIAPRPERLVILAAGLVLAGLMGGVGTGEMTAGGVDLFTFYERGGGPALALALGLITILSAITVLQRIVHVKHQLDNEQ